MATIGSGAYTLVDIAKGWDPDGSQARVVELLNQKNAILQDMLWREGNLPTGHQITVRTGLPTVSWRLLNKGVAKSKGTKAQITEQVGILEARSEVDKDEAELNGNVNAFRLSEANAFIEAMNQEFSSTLFYGNSGTSPEEFTGFAPRYASTTANNGNNVMLAGGAGADNSSMWLIGWGENEICGIYPKASKAGLIHEDLGIGDAFDSDNNRFRAYMDRWQWKPGLAVKDWRYAVRIANIDLSDLIGLTGTQAVSATTFLPKLMSRAIDRLPNPNGVRMVFYANRTVMSNLRVAALEKSNSVLSIQEGLDQFGRRIMNDLTFLGVPVRMVDSLLENESLVA